MANVAVVNDGKVVNLALFESADTIGDFDFTVAAGEGAFGIEVPEGEFVNIGYSYEKGTFTAPPPTAEEEAAIEAADIAANAGTKTALMDEASQRISVLQDAVDLDMATDEETAVLPLWKKYRVLLSRIDANTSETIAFPEKPE